MMPIRAMLVGGGNIPPAGALVYRAGSASAGTIAFDSETYDLIGWHDNVTNNSRLTVPAGSNVSLLRLIGLTDSGSTLNFTKGGSSVPGIGRERGVSSPTPAISAVLAVSVADYFEAVTSGSLVAGNKNWFAVEPIAATSKYALVTKSTNQSITSGGGLQTITWDQETADVGGWHDNVTNNSRLTVPSGVTRVRITVGVSFASASAQVVLQTLLKNGVAVTSGSFLKDEDPGTAICQLTGMSAILAVTSGDYFECQVSVNTTRNLLTGDDTWMCIEEVPDYARALAKKSASQSFTGGAAAVAIQWDDEEYDTASIHDSVTNNTRLTVPAGVTQARLAFNVQTANIAGVSRATVGRNGSTTPEVGLPSDSCDTGGSDNLGAPGAWVSVSPGDYFELFLTQANTGSIAASVANWFFMECR